MKKPNKGSADDTEAVPPIPPHTVHGRALHSCIEKA
jgi:hypothetical protein